MKSNRVIHTDGVIRYKNYKGLHHRLDGPAIKFPKDHYNCPNYMAYFINGRFIGSNDFEINLSNDGLFIKSAKEFRRLMKLKAFL